MLRFVVLACLTAVPCPVHADPGCLLIADFPKGDVVKQTGDCDQRQSPMSSFKIALAAMGFDAGVLVDGHHPAWPYENGYTVNKDNDRQTTDPAMWLENSVVWYSQKLTAAMGMATLQKYVDRFHYGNRDLSGDPGLQNGLSHAWLMSSLKISPVEQVTFIGHLLSKNLDMADKAYDKTMDIVPRFDAKNGWQVHGKTGSGWLTDDKGRADKNHPLGWFVGWADHAGRKIIFAKLIVGDKPSDVYAGIQARDDFLQTDLPAIK